MKFLKQKILFLLYFTQSYTPAKNFKKEVDYLSYNFLYSLLASFKQASIRKAVGELVEEGNLDKIVRNNQTFFRLTIVGDKQVQALFPGFFYQSSAKKGWFFAILKEKKDARDVRRHLKNFGFVRFIRGVYVRPAPRGFEGKLESLIGKAFFIFTQKLDLMDEKSLVGSLWDLDRCYKKSADFVTKANELLKKIDTKKRLSKKEKKSISLLIDNFFIIIKNTIRLPKNLLPADWPLPKAATLFSKILKKVE